MASSILTSNVITAALNERGYTETPRNITKYWKRLRPGLQGAPWCGAFATDVWLTAGFDLRPHVNPYSASALRSWARGIGAYKTTRANAGDIVLYGFGDSKLEHIGVAWPDENASGYRAIEGNTSPGTSGSQSNGGGVYVRYRGRKSIDGWVDMAKVLAHYGVANAAAAAEAAVDAVTGALDVDGRFGRATAKEVQRRLGVTVDGRMGIETVMAWQRHEGTPVDAVISGQVPRDYGNGIVPGVMHVNNRQGSALIRKVQANLNGGGYGLDVDGKLGPATIKALQDALNKSEGTLR